MLNLELLASS